VAPDTVDPGVTGRDCAGRRRRRLLRFADPDPDPDPGPAGAPEAGVSGRAEGSGGVEDISFIS
jgi:hypothetical protein